MEQALGFPNGVPTASSGNPWDPTSPGGGPPTAPRTMPNFNPSSVKTKLCTRFMNGMCQYGAACSFAHGEADLKRGSFNPDSGPRKVRLCNKLTDPGGCPYGDRCTFAHEMKPGVLPAIGGSSSAEGPGGGGGMGGGGNFPMLGPNGQPFNFKTKVCNKWLAGACPFGEKCHFAHGHQEVRQRAPLPGGDVPGAGEGNWQDTLAALRSGGVNLPTQFAPPPSALATVAAAAAGGDFAYAGNPFGDYIAELVEPEAAAEAAAEAAEAAAEAAEAAAGAEGAAAGVNEQHRATVEAC